MRIEDNPKLNFLSRFRRHSISNRKDVSKKNATTSGNKIKAKLPSSRNEWTTSDVGETLLTPSSVNVQSENEKEIFEKVKSACNGFHLK